MMKSLRAWIYRWLLLLTRPSPVIPNQQLLGRALIKTDPVSNAKYWVTANADWLDRVDLPINESLGISLKLFKPGTTIEIIGQYEPDVEKINE
jgi:hypothetical protein